MKEIPIPEERENLELLNAYGRRKSSLNYSYDSSETGRLDCESLASLKSRIETNDMLVHEDGAST